MNDLQLRLSDAERYSRDLVMFLREAHSLAELAIRSVLSDAVKLQQRVEQLAGAAR